MAKKEHRFSLTLNASTDHKRCPDCGLERRDGPGDTFLFFYGGRWQAATLATLPACAGTAERPPA